MDAINTEQSVSLSAGNGTSGDSFLTPSTVGARFDRRRRGAGGEFARRAESHLVVHTCLKRYGDLITFMSTTLEASTWLRAMALLDCK